jgi:ABC-type Zn2+ transport system substrate-binding protein/surface adhesin
MQKIYRVISALFFASVLTACTEGNHSHDHDHDHGHSHDSEKHQNTTGHHDTIK